jgi:hypothetical protein
MLRTAVLLSACLTLAACASSSRHVEPVSVPMDPYMKLSCAELKTEQASVNKQITRVSDYIDDASIGSRIAMGVGVMFWPALFLVDGKGDAQDELARLKGQQISIDDAMLERDCGNPLQARQTDRTAPNALSDRADAH